MSNNNGKRGILRNVLNNVLAGPTKTNWTDERSAAAALDADSEAAGVLLDPRMAAMVQELEPFQPTSTW